MVRKFVNSSSIKSIGYNSSSHVLEVEFVTGSIYRYDDVPELVFAQFDRADSKGQFFDFQIRDKYQFTKMSN